MTARAARLPFSAVVGLDDVKLALLLAASQPRLGGVLLRGEKGSAKTTLARGLAALLPGSAPFVELPLGAAEDRVLGSIDVAELLTAGSVRARPGLLAAAHGGVLYVDEVNLLADHLVDALLDVAVSGVNRLERDGLSHAHDARFVLVGSMNPEEGELRPQLLDRFGLAVDVRAPSGPGDRAEAVRRQLALEAGGALEGVEAADEALRARLASAVPAAVGDEVLELASRVALEVGAEGLRADLMLCRAAAALAGWEGRASATAGDLRRVAPLVLAHRRRRQPFDEPGISEQELDEAFDQALGSPAPEGGGDAPPDASEVEAPGAPSRPPDAPSPRRGGQAAGRRSGAAALTSSTAGRVVGDRPLSGPSAPVAAVASAMAVARRRAVAPGPPVERGDLREVVRQQRRGNLVVLVVDTSGSMGAARRVAAAKGAALGLLADAYQRRDRVALVAFRGERAEVVLRPTGSVEIARARLAELPTGGPTPLAAGLDAALGLVTGSSGDVGLDALVVLISDGRATVGGADPVAEAHRSAARLVAAGVRAVVVDAEAGVPRLGIARELASSLGAECVALDDLAADQLERAIRARLAG